MNRKLLALSRFGFIAVFLSVLLVAGCSDNLPLNPSTDLNPAPQFAPGAKSNNHHDPILKGSLVTYDTLYIVADSGGAITVKRDPYQHEFKVYPGSLDDDAMIILSTYPDFVWGKDAIIFDFSPDGLDFSIPAKINFEMAEIDPKAKNGRLYRYESVSGIWIQVSVKPVKDGHVKFDIDHFSKYAISD